MYILDLSLKIILCTVLMHFAKINDLYLKKIFFLFCFVSLPLSNP